jgi:hypothetical protein
MTVRTSEIDRRLDFLKKEYQRGFPPPNAMQAKPVVAAAHADKLSLHKPPGIHNMSNAFATRTSGLIAPTKKSRQVMRSISGLGMEDPVFGTTEEGPKHPSNIFEDMSLGDLPEDMRDIVSVASDPTADPARGIDVSMYHMSLGDLNASMSDFSMRELTIPKQKQVQAKTGYVYGPFAVQERDEESEVSGESFQLDKLMEPEIKLDDSHVTEPLSLEPDEEAKTKKANRFTKSSTSPPTKPTAKILEKLNASLQSLPSLSLEDVLFGVPSPPQSPNPLSDDDAAHHHNDMKVQGHKSKTSVISKNSLESNQSIARKAKRLVGPRTAGKGGGLNASTSNLNVTHNSRIRGVHPTFAGARGNLMAEAAMEAQRQGGMSDDLLHAAFSQSLQEFPVSSLPQQNTSDASLGKSSFHHVSRNTSLLVVNPHNLHIPPSQPHNSKQNPPLPVSQQRALPSMSTIFPVAGTSSKSKRLRARRPKVPLHVSKSTSSEGLEDLAQYAPHHRRGSGFTGISELTPATAFDTSSVRVQRSRGSLTGSVGLAPRIVGHPVYL